MDKEISDCEAKLIKAINVDTVHKICSGQVVLNLATAVKELVENALDAGATIIDVRFKNYGIDLIEVSDNGTGVTEDNFAAMTLKYHTSKLNHYEDLLGVSSFGFRGEALSSLCALSNLIITTKHHNSQFASKLEYDNKGNIVKTTPCSRQVGTTVTLLNLFSSLPVRQKEFHKNAKREFNKMTQLLYAYCLISIGVKITCTNQNSSNSKSVVIATHGSSSHKDNIACVFGSKQLQTILELRPEYVCNIKDNIFKGISSNIEEIDENITIEDIEVDLSEDSNDAENEIAKLSQNTLKSQGYKNITTPVEFVGFISTCTHGSGRSSTDRQFYFINSRPCEPVKIMKLINEVYRQFNPHQYPFVFLNISLDKSSIDVNVTPDKRKIFLTKEKYILNIVKNSLLKLYEDIPRTLKITLSDTVNTNEPNKNVSPSLHQPRIFNSFLQKFANKSIGILESTNNIKEEQSTELKRKSTSMLDYVSAKTIKMEENIQEHEHLVKTEILTNDIEEVNRTNVDINDKEIEEISVKNDTQIMYLEHTDKLPNTQIRNLDDVVIEKSHKIYCNANKQSLEPCSIVKKIVTDKEDLGKHNRHCITLKTSFEHVKILFDLYSSKNNNKVPDRVRFRSVINPVFNKKCEEELSREISKDSFAGMSVVGQFNLGFIVAQLEDDLFIIDQHASDEIYNFETLQKTTELTTQKLVIPQQLELTGVNEQILMDNLEIFKKNGFVFDIDVEAPPTKRVKLISLPLSKNWVFGKEDIEELLFMLRESPNEYCRPSRVRAMFASRACRKSVMIGTALSKSDMKTLINHMAEIDRPWNCPHGRPTIRHLVNLAMIHIND